MPRPKAVPATDMNYWEMACSILVGLRQAVSKAQAEHGAIRAANPGKMFVSEASIAADTCDVLREAERVLDRELSKVARSSSLPFPEQGNT
ncbi:hypothetical protein [uncultured Roseobacter sp.]|uniref:hypothetical protein n=1 Tax=uncultured Roseobacter sp. TaxID=114847 RepID=UPI0026153B34|nr:hypothetical protein [uncultured Roseobacter sp.]